jgi:hypothetical protein
MDEWESISLLSLAQLLTAISDFVCGSVVLGKHFIQTFREVKMSGRYAYLPPTGIKVEILTS